VIFTILPDIKSPEDLKKLSPAKLPELAKEIRSKIIEIVGKNGGHLASNLGVVELTIAIHRVFNSPEDAIVFDVSHQCYAHKILTGRSEEFSTLRMHSGLSGFTRRNESEHDFFNNGHASTSISQALGLLTAWQLEGKNNYVVAVIGDGALTGGMAFEALSHAGQLNKNLIVILNDNEMSISKNNSALSRYLSSLSISRSYHRFKGIIEKLVTTKNDSRTPTGKFLSRIKRGIKGAFLANNLFTDLGFEYVGPLNGHSMPSLENVLRKAKSVGKPVVVHVRTKKGKGYSPAEDNPALFHGIGPFQISDGKVEKSSSMSFTQAFSNAILDEAKINSRICAITAAMAKGTGLEAFGFKYPSRFFDVGIAEEHAVTFAAGLSAGGMIPVVSIYSTFIQRSVDQIIHDVALPGFPVVVVLDRAGIVPGDGSTHQGMFDISLLRCVPDITILCPESASSLKLCLNYAVNRKAPVVIRYPKLCCPEELEVFASPVEEGKGVLVKCNDYLPVVKNKKDEKSQVLFVCTGGIYQETLEASKILILEGVRSDIYCLRFIKPLDENYFVSLCKDYESIVFVEDGVITGGISEYLSSVLVKTEPSFAEKTAVKAFPDKFISHGTRKEICQDCKMTGYDIALKALELRGE